MATQGEGEQLVLPPSELLVGQDPPKYGVHAPPEFVQQVPIATQGEGEHMIPLVNVEPDAHVVEVESVQAPPRFEQQTPKGHGEGEQSAPFRNTFPAGHPEAVETVQEVEISQHAPPHGLVGEHATPMPRNDPVQAAGSVGVHPPAPLQHAPSVKATHEKCKESPLVRLLVPPPVLHEYCVYPPVPPASCTPAVAELPAHIPVSPYTTSNEDVPSYSSTSKFALPQSAMS